MSRTRKALGRVLRSWANRVDPPAVRHEIRFADDADVVQVAEKLAERWEPLLNRLAAR